MTLSHPLFDDIDYDRRWIERQIRLVEDGPSSPWDETPDKQQQRRAYLERLYHIRDRMKGDR